MPLRVQPVVEGHGEDAAIRPLLERMWYELLAGDRIDVLKAFRKPQGKLLQEIGLKQAVNAAKIRLDNLPPDNFHKLVLVLIDSEGKCPATLAPDLLRWAQEARSDADIVCVMPHPMFEVWLAAAASSLAGVNGLPSNLETPNDPEANGLGKAWLRKRISRKYSETVDQPRFAAKIDLSLCRKNSPLFDKLCRELQQRLPGGPVA